MKSSTAGSLMLAASANLAFATITLKDFHLLSFTADSVAYCLSPNEVEPSETLKTSEATSLCSSIPSSIQLPQANITTDECSCKSWHVGPLTALACNCNSCAAIEVENFELTCTKLAEGCMTGEELYWGGYLENLGVGMRGYLALFVEGGLERSKFSVGCGQKATESTENPTDNETGNRHTGEGTEIDMPDLWRDIPDEFVEVVEEVVYLDKPVPTSSTNPKDATNLESPPKDLTEAKKQKEKDAADEEQRAKDAASEEARREKQAAKEKVESDKKLLKEKTKKYGYLNGLTDEEWDRQIKEDKGKGTYPKPFLWDLNRLGYIVACKIGIRHACVWVARWDPDPRH